MSPPGPGVAPARRPNCPRPRAGAVAPEWWKAFRPTLDALSEEVLSGNRELARARARDSRRRTAPRAIRTVAGPSARQRARASARIETGGAARRRSPWGRLSCDAQSRYELDRGASSHTGARPREELLAPACADTLRTADGASREILRFAALARRSAVVFHARASAKRRASAAKSAIDAGAERARLAQAQAERSATRSRPELERARGAPSARGAAAVSLRAGARARNHSVGREALRWSPAESPRLPSTCYSADPM